MVIPQQHTLVSGGDPLVVYEWGQPDQPTVIFFHATGFHARCWDELARALPDFHCYAVDSRGHGRSTQALGANLWQQCGVDAANIARTLNLSGAIGVGHSMGGNMLVRAAAAVPDAFVALLLLDPVIFLREWYQRDTYTIEGNFVLSRRRDWDSWEAMFERFKARPPFAGWQAAILRDYCQYGLLPTETGFTLACRPETEAHIYESALLKQNADVYEAIAGIRVPVRVLRCATPSQAANDMLNSPTAPDLASHFRDGLDVPLADNSHFIPMESPSLVVAHIRELAANLRPAP